MLGTMCSFNTINGGKYGSVQAKTVEAGAYLRCIDDKDLAQDTPPSARSRRIRR